MLENIFDGGLSATLDSDERYNVISELYYTIENIERAMYNAGKLSVQTAIIRELNLQHLIGSAQMSQHFAYSDSHGVLRQPDPEALQPIIERKD
jgi:hypothetical protein